MYTNIMDNDILPNFDAKLNLSDACKSFVQALLIKNPENRLGSKNGFEEVKSHAFFFGIDWTKILARKNEDGIQCLKP